MAARIAVFAGILAILSLLLAACLPLSTPRVVKIGLIAPFEGPSRPFGYSILYAVKLRLNQWNEAGGEPRVELVALNDDGDPALAATLPAQLAVDPDVMVILGPPQGHTAAAAWPVLSTLTVPTLSLVPLPDDLGLPLIPFAGRARDVHRALQGFGLDATLAYTAPVAGPLVWLGDPYTLATLLQEHPEQVVAAGSVALEDAFVGWAGERAQGLPWVMPMPVSWPPPWAEDYEKLAGGPPSPMAALAYSAVDQLLPLLGSSPDRLRLGQQLAPLQAPSLQVLQRLGNRCCVPYVGD